MVVMISSKRFEDLAVSWPNFSDDRLTSSSIVDYFQSEGADYLTSIYSIYSLYYINIRFKHFTKETMYVCGLFHSSFYIYIS